MLLVILAEKNSLKRFMKKYCKKHFKKEFKVEKVIRRKVINYILNGKATIVLLIAELIKRHNMNE